MPSSETHRPSLRAQRAAIASALGVDPWAVYQASRVLTGLHQLPPPRATAMIIIALLAHLNRDGEAAAQLPNRIERVASFKLRGRPTTRGSLPPSLRYFELDMTFSRITETLLATLSTPEGLQPFVRPGGIVRPDAINLALYGGEKAVLSIKTVSGNWEGQFGPPNSPPIVPAPLWRRIGLNSGALIELSRLCAGDIAAEDRAAYFAGWRPLFVEGAQPATATAPQPAPAPQAHSRQCGHS